MNGARKQRHDGSTTDPDSKQLDFLTIHRKYLDAALRGHTQDFLNLNKNNADAACLASCLICLAAEAMLQDRPMQPCSPPIQWLQTTRGAGKVFVVAWEWIGNDDGSIARQLTFRSPECKDPSILYTSSNRDTLLHLLYRNQADIAEEDWSPEIEEAYATRLSVIGSIRTSIEAKASSNYIYRRIILFPTLVQRQFVVLVEACQPRALVVLGHYFKLLASYHAM